MYLYTHLCISVSLGLPRPFTPTFGVGHCSYAFITLVNALFGATCHALYGDDVKPNVMDNMAGSPVVDAVKALICVDLLFTIPPVFACVRMIVETALFAPPEPEPEPDLGASY